MANPKLSRLAARLFNQYKVPIDKGFEWATELETANSEEDLSPELRAFLGKPYYINSKPEKNKSSFGERMNDMSSAKVFVDGKWVPLDTQQT
jgi:hypothetical protein